MDPSADDVEADDGAGRRVGETVDSVDTTPSTLDDVRGAEGNDAGTNPSDDDAMLL